MRLDEIRGALLPVDRLMDLPTPRLLAYFKKVRGQFMTMDPYTDDPYSTPIDVYEETKEYLHTLKGLLDDRENVE